MNPPTAGTVYDFSWPHPTLIAVQPLVETAKYFSELDVKFFHIPSLSIWTNTTKSQLSVRGCVKLALSTRWDSNNLLNRNMHLRVPYLRAFHCSSQATPEEGRDSLELLPLPAVDEAGAGDALQAEQREGDAATGKKCASGGLSLGRCGPRGR